MIVVSPDTEQVIGPSSPDFGVIYDPVDTVLSAEDTQDFDFNGATLTESTSASISRDATIEVASGSVEPVSVNSDSPLIEIADGAIRSTGAPGVARILCRRGTTIKGINHQAGITGASSSIKFKNYLADSLGELLWSSVDNRLTEGSNTPRFTSFNHASANYVPNPNLWASGLDFSGVSVWNSSSNNVRRGAVAVAPDIVVMANHFPVQNGGTVRYLDSGSQVVERTIAASRTIPNSDIRVGLLNSPLPETVTFYKVLPADYRNRLWFEHQIPVVCPSQDMIIGLRETTHMDMPAYSQHPNAPSNHGVHGADNPFVGSNLPERVARRMDVRSGDSGQPCLYCLGNELILVGTWATASGFAAIKFYADQINAAIQDMGSGSTLSIVDLSGFTDFSQ